MLDAKGLEAAARKLRNAEKEKFGSWPDADDSKSIAAATVTAYLQAVGPESAVAVRPLVNQIDALLTLKNPVPRIPNLARSLLASARSALVATPPAETVVEALRNWTGWRSIDTAPEDCRVLLATAGNWVGEAIMLRDEETGEQVWTWVDTGKPSLHSCYGWMPLPEHLLAPVLSDLRPDGFDGPTGAE